MNFSEAKAAWQDYNDFLSTHSDYAYERLGDGFGEMFGDRPEVDTIVEVIRKANAGALTVDDAIDMVTATINVMPPDAIEEIEGLRAQLEMYRELKDLQIDGEEVKVFLTLRWENEVSSIYINSLFPPLTSVRIVGAFSIAPTGCFNIARLMSTLFNKIR